MQPASILVTDDESNIRMMVRTALESDGYNVTEASDGHQALELLKFTSPQLMVLDLNMPVLDGMAVLEQMKSLSKQHRPRVIVLTAYGSISTAVKATRLGATDFLEKPLTPAVLRNAVRSVLDEPEDEEAPEVPLKLAGEYEAVLERIRRSLRFADAASAESLLMKVADRRDLHSAEYFNLLGALYETQHKWRLACKCYGKALTANETYAPARMNMRRIQELRTKGRTTEAIALGDESTDVWHARLPEPKA
jgi:DNA-binding response OmpR family regulator